MIKRLLYPQKCLVCGEVQQGEVFLCERCKKQIKYIPRTICVVCGKTITENDTGRCHDCIATNHTFISNRGVFEYNDQMKKIMYDLKYRHRRETATFLGKEVVRNLGAYIRGLNLDGIVPIPLHKERKRERGYNQSELIARVIGQECGIRIYPNYLTRIKSTRPQKELNDKERKNNVKNAFLIGKNEVQLKRIMLVDDIYTTGATLDAAAHALEGNGEVDVYGLTVCIGRGY